MLLFCASLALCDDAEVRRMTAALFELQQAFLNYACL